MKKRTKRIQGFVIHPWFYLVFSACHRTDQHHNKSDCTDTASSAKLSTAKAETSTAAGSKKKKNKYKQQADRQQLDEAGASKETGEGEIDVKALTSRAINPNASIFDFTPQALEQKIDGNHSTFLSWIIQLKSFRKELLNIVEHPNRNSKLLAKITNMALNTYNHQGRSALYNLAYRPNLRTTFQELVKNREVANKLTKEGLCRIGPNGWAPLHRIYQDLAIFPTVIDKINTLCKKANRCYRDASSGLGKSLIYTALHIAAKKGAIESDIVLLIENRKWGGYTC